jgi:cell division protein ZapA (FtsZ GTPase activity inhibitor)
MADKITIRILNRDYHVDDNGDPLYINALARYVEDKMKEAGQKDNIVETSRLAVHAALSITGELFRLRENDMSSTGVNAHRIDKLLKDLSRTINIDA